MERRKAEALSLEKRIKDYESRSSRTLTERAAAQQKVRLSLFSIFDSIFEMGGNEEGWWQAEGPCLFSNLSNVSVVICDALFCLMFECSKIGGGAGVAAGGDVHRPSSRTHQGDTSRWALNWGNHLLGCINVERTLDALCVKHTHHAFF